MSLQRLKYSSACYGRVKVNLIISPDKLNNLNVCTRKMKHCSSTIHGIMR